MPRSPTYWNRSSSAKPSTSRATTPAHSSPSKAANAGDEVRTKKGRKIRAATCRNCGCNQNETSLWRSNPEPAPHGVENVLCNACGLWINEHKIQRPQRYWAKRRSSSSSPSPSPSFRASTPATSSAGSPTKRTRRSGRTQAETRAVLAGDDIEEEQEDVTEAARIILAMKRKGSAGQTESGAGSEGSAGSPISPASLSLRPSWIYNQPPRMVQPVLPPQMIPRIAPPDSLRLPPLRFSDPASPLIRSPLPLPSRPSVLRITDLLRSPK